MFVKKKKKTNPLVYLGIFIGVFYIVLRFASACYDGFSFEAIAQASEGLNIFDISKIIINQDNLTYSFGAALFAVCGTYSVLMARRPTALNQSHGNARFADPVEIEPYKDKDILNNIILTKDIQVAKDMGVSKRNRNIVLVGRPGTGKSRYFFKPNILNASGTIVVTDPKGELLRDCGYSLKQKGYTIKVLNLDKKPESNRYNCFNYIRKINKDEMSYDRRKEWSEDSIAEDDVMSLIDCIFKNTKGDIDTSTGDPFWEKAEMLFLQALFYYVLLSGEYKKEDRNFKSIMALIKEAKPTDEKGNSKLNDRFKAWEERLKAECKGINIGIMQWDLFQNSAGSVKTMSTIILTASARLGSMNIKEISDLVETDDMELYRIGKAGDEGKIAYFIITKPGEGAFNFIANIFYSQVFKIIDYNAFLNHGSLATSVDLYMDEWAQLGEIPRFVEQLAYVRGLNCGIVIGLQSLSQLKKVYKDAWETALDCCDYKILMGSESEETLKYFSSLMGKETIIERDDSQSKGPKGSHSVSLKEMASDLATVDQLRRMEKGKCILLVSGLNVFYGDMYDLAKHPLYNQLYEPWNKNDLENNKREYNHLATIKEYESQQHSKKELSSVGIEVSSTTRIKFRNKNLQLDF